MDPVKRINRYRVQLDPLECVRFWEEEGFWSCIPQYTRNSKIRMSWDLGRVFRADDTALFHFSPTGFVCNLGPYYRPCPKGGGDINVFVLIRLREGPRGTSVQSFLLYPTMKFSLTFLFLSYLCSFLVCLLYHRASERPFPIIYCKLFTFFPLQSKYE